MDDMPATRKPYMNRVGVLLREIPEQDAAVSRTHVTTSDDLRSCGDRYEMPNGFVKIFDSHDPDGAGWI